MNQSANLTDSGGFQSLFTSGYPQYYWRRGNSFKIHQLLRKCSSPEKAISIQNNLEAISWCPWWMSLALSTLWKIDRTDQPELWSWRLTVVRSRLGIVQGAGFEDAAVRPWSWSAWTSCDNSIGGWLLEKAMKKWMRCLILQILFAGRTSLLFMGVGAPDSPIDVIPWSDMPTVSYNADCANETLHDQGQDAWWWKKCAICWRLYAARSWMWLLHLRITPGPISPPPRKWMRPFGIRLTSYHNSISINLMKQCPSSDHGWQFLEFRAFVENMAITSQVGISRRAKSERTKAGERKTTAIWK